MRALATLLMVGAVFFAALAEYIVGRILLPEMGLTAPGYWTWFAVSVWIVVAFAIPGAIVKGVLE